MRLRGKLALVALVLAAPPLAGVAYLREMERFLVATQQEALAATARAVATALHDRPEILAYRPPEDEADLRRAAERELRALAGLAPEGSEAAPGPVPEPGRDEVGEILRALERANLRIWVVRRDYRVLALAGGLREVDPLAGRLAALVARLLPELGEGSAEEEADAPLAAQREIAAALEGVAQTRLRPRREGGALAVAAHPVWVGDTVHAAVVVEETTQRVAALRNEAFARLLLLTVGAFALAAAALAAFAGRLSRRIRRLRDAAEAAIDAHGRLRGPFEASGARDEIGDLARGFSAVLGRLRRYTAALETMAGRLAHELRTPVAIVRSSLENLRAARDAEESRQYLERAEEGLRRLSAILQRMAEAGRLEQTLAESPRERFDAAGVVRGCVEGYRLAYAPRRFALDAPEEALWLHGAPDLFAQMLDKLVENAADFAAGESGVRIALAREGDAVLLRVENDGPPLPEAIRETLFESLVSVRSESARAGPHLGLGLYIARLIAEYHGGRLQAENLPGGSGVAVSGRFPAA